ncbi:ankyrin repeat-containing domain protein [Nemania serpens]|nr:ankyrin repeat-containing domain protein [Nemania serpens]
MPGIVPRLAEPSAGLYPGPPPFPDDMTDSLPAPESFSPSAMSFNQFNRMSQLDDSLRLDVMELADMGVLQELLAQHLPPNPTSDPILSSIGGSTGSAARMTPSQYSSGAYSHARSTPPPPPPPTHDNAQRPMLETAFASRATALSSFGTDTSGSRSSSSAGTSPPSSHGGGSSSSNDARWGGAMHIAAQQGHEKIIRVLIGRSVDCNEKDSDGRTPLIHAVVQNQEAVVLTLLGHGARLGETDRQDRSALHYAVLHQRENMLKILLPHYKNNPQSLQIDAKDESGWTALHMAIYKGFEPGVDLLLQCGANMNTKASFCPYTGAVIPHS